MNMMKKYLAGIVLCLSAFGALSVSADTGALLIQPMIHGKVDTSNPSVLTLVDGAGGPNIKVSNIPVGAAGVDFFLLSSDGQKEYDDGSIQTGVTKRITSMFFNAVPSPTSTPNAYPPAPYHYAGIRVKITDVSGNEIVRGDSPFAIQINQNQYEIKHPIVMPVITSTVLLGSPTVDVPSHRVTPQRVPVTGNPIVLGRDQKLHLKLTGISKAVQSECTVTGYKMQLFLESSDGKPELTMSPYTSLCFSKTKGADTYETTLDASMMSSTPPALYSGFRVKFIDGQNNVFGTVDTPFAVQVNLSSYETNNPPPAPKNYALSIVPQKTSYKIGYNAIFKITTDAPKGKGIHQIFTSKVIDSSGTEIRIGGLGSNDGRNLSFDTHNLNPGQFTVALTLEVRQDLKPVNGVVPTINGLTYTVLGTGTATSSPITLTSGKAGASVFDAVRSFWDSL